MYIHTYIYVRKVRMMCIGWIDFWGLTTRSADVIVLSSDKLKEIKRFNVKAKWRRRTKGRKGSFLKIVPENYYFLINDGAAVVFFVKFGLLTHEKIGKFFPEKLPRSFVQLKKFFRHEPLPYEHPLRRIILSQDCLTCLHEFSWQVLNRRLYETSS